LRVRSTDKFPDGLLRRNGSHPNEIQPRAISCDQPFLNSINFPMNFVETQSSSVRLVHQNRYLLPRNLRAAELYGSQNFSTNTLNLFCELIHKLPNEFRTHRKSFVWQGTNQPRPAWLREIINEHLCRRESQTLIGPVKVQKRPRRQRCRCLTREPCLWDGLPRRSALPTRSATSF
jgi:hypothetical protein